MGNKVENSILENNSLEGAASAKPETQAALSYESYGGSNFEDQNLLNLNPNFMVSGSAVKVDTATPSSVNYDKNQHSTYLPSPSPSPYLPSSSSQPFSPELPSFITPTSHAPTPPPTTQKVNYITENSLTKITNTLLNNANLSPPFTHSAITHGEVDAVVLDDDLPTHDQFYGQTSSAGVSYGQQQSPKPTPSKVTYIKPAFKPKPTTSASEPTTDKYVLVHTISNDKTSDKQPTPTSSNDSIDSIILMLNETKAGSQYSTSPVTETIEVRETTTTTAQTRYPTTSSINYDKYGPTSFYITTKLPAPTKVPNKTSRPTASSPAHSYTVSSQLDFQNSISTKFATSTTTAKPLVTSYISSTVIPKRPTTTASLKKGTTKKPVTKRPAPTSNKVTAAGLVTKKQPTKSPVLIASTTHSVSPTQYISSTPTVIVIKRPQQPILSIVHEDTVQISGGAITDRPHPTVHITPKPVNNSVSTVSYTKIPTRIGNPTSTPFVTKRPASVLYTTGPYIFETPSPSSPTQGSNYNNYYTPTTIVSTTAIYSGEQLDHHYYDQDVLNEKPSGSADENAPSNDDLISFPPVRHPNLNMSSDGSEQKPLNTPVFIEDEKLNNKMNLLVSKIVASLQGNFENLEDLVNDSNVTAKPLITRRPPQAATAVTRRPTTTTGRPKTTTRPRTTTTKRPLQRVTTTTRKPTTRRPVTVAAPVTRKPTTRPTTRRPKPTRKATTTTTSTEASVQEDEYVEEVSEDYEEGTEQGEAGQARIRKFIH